MLSPEINTNNDEIINFILNEALGVKCNYCDYSDPNNKQLNNKGSYISYDDMIEHTNNENYRMDCTSVIQNLIKRWYLKDIDFTNENIKLIKLLLNKLDLSFNKFFSNDFNDNNKGRLIYLENTLFYKLKEEIIDKKLFGLETNSMGWWCICLGKSAIYKLSYKSLFLEEIDDDEFCYLTFWGKRDGTENTMAICKLDTIKNTLIEKGNNDLERSISKVNDSISINAINGIINIIKNRDNLHDNIIKVHNLNTLNTFTYDSSKPITQICSMLTLKGNNLLYNY